MSPVKRFKVSEGSMTPAFNSGDGVVAIVSRRVRRGQVRCFEHPDRPGFWLIKRVGRVVWADHGTMFEARSDNATAAAVDSRHFGLVSLSGSYLVVLRVPL